MTQDDFKELEEGKKWFEELVRNAQDVKIPAGFNFLKRRIFQLKCTSFLTQSTESSHFKLLMRYILGSGYILHLILKSKLSGHKIKATTFSIWDSDIDSHVNYQAFDTFLNSNQIISLNDKNFIFVKSSKSKIELKNALYSSNPIYDALVFLDISLIDLFELIRNIYQNFFIYLKISLKCPIAKGLFKDFFIEPIIKLYTKKGMTKFYRTNSDLHLQEFWCENIDYNTVWYSINSRSIQFKNTSFGASPEYPLFSFMHFGTSWTWNEESAAWLRNIYEHKVNVVGPIMFYSLSSTKTEKDNSKNRKKLLIFDVTPFKESHIRGQIFQKGFNYYNEECCIKFITDILTALEGKEWDVELKPKRRYLTIHSDKYIDFLLQAETKYPHFKVLPFQSNLFDQIRSSDLVITIPLSSPFEIAKSMNIPSIYFDPSGDIDFESMGYDKSDYVINLEGLRERINLLSQ